MEPALTLPEITIPIGDIVTLVLYFVLGAYVIFTGILYYHWNAYSTDGKVTGYTLIAYFATTLPLLAVMGIITLILT